MCKKNAEREEIRESYLKLARLYHPDICKGSEEYFAHLTSAYQTLMDDNKRVEYDNDNVYTKDYFSFNLLGHKIDTRNIFWTFILVFGTYRGYKYYQDNYVIQCPLSTYEKMASVDLEHRNQVSKEKD